MDTATTTLLPSVHGFDLLSTASAVALSRQATKKKKKHDPYRITHSVTARTAAIASGKPAYARSWSLHFDSSLHFFRQLESVKGKTAQNGRRFYKEKGETSFSIGARPR